jgi:hypothetical protein
LLTLRTFYQISSPALSIKTAIPNSKNQEELVAFFGAKPLYPAILNLRLERICTGTINELSRPFAVCDAIFSWYRKFHQVGVESNGNALELSSIWPKGAEKSSILTIAF